MTQPKPKPQQDIESDAQQAEIEALKLGWQRTQADFENFRRRTKDEQSMHVTIGVSRALANFLPIAENLRRSLAQMPIKPEMPSDTQAWIGGVTQVARQFDQALAAAGLIAIEPKPGDTFDPKDHEAIGHVPDAVQPVDAIIQTVERGYRAGEQVLTPAKVVVSAGPPADDSKK